MKHIVFTYLDNVIPDQIAQELEGPFAIQELKFFCSTGYDPSAADMDGINNYCISKNSDTYYKLQFLGTFNIATNR